MANDPFDKLLVLARQMLEEAMAIKVKNTLEGESHGYDNGVWVGINRIVKLIERQKHENGKSTIK